MSPPEHIPDNTLAALLDGSLMEHEIAAAKKHLDLCRPCQLQYEEMQKATAHLAAIPPQNPQLVAQIVNRATQKTKRPNWPRRAFVVALPLAATVCLALFLSRPSEREPKEWQARGSAQHRPPVHLKLFAVNAPGTIPQLTRLAQGDRLNPVELSLTLVLDHLPTSKQRYAAVYARESNGRVTWLYPTWSANANTPKCLPLPNTPGQLQSDKVVTLESVAAGPLEVGVLVFAKPCSIDNLDHRLESGWQPDIFEDPALSFVEKMMLHIGG